MVVPLTWLAVSTVVFVLLTVLYVVEDARGGRIILAGVRTRLDTLCSSLFVRVSRLTWSVWHGLVQFVLRHGVHRALGIIMNQTERLELRVERLVLRHRKAMRERARTHLDEIAEHKQANALSEAERNRLRDQ